MTDNATEITRDNIIPPDIHFFNAEHLEGNAGQIWDQVKNLDYIFMELITDQGLRMDLENTINYGAANPDPLEKARVINMINGAGVGQLLSNLAAKVIESGKEIYFIDVNTGEPADIDAKRAYEHSANAQKQFLEGDIENSFENFRDFINLLAESSNEREEITTDEIQGIIDQDSEKFSGKKIGVVQGAIHTRTFHNIKAGNPASKVTRAFPTSDYYFPSNISLARRIMYGKPVAEEDYKRAYLSHFIIADKLIDLKGYEMSDREIFKEATRIAWKIEPEELNNVWDKLKAGSLNAEELVKKGMTI